MSDSDTPDNKGNVIGLVTNKEIQNQPDEEVIKLLENALENAKKGVLQEVILIGMDNDGYYHTGMAVSPVYDSGFLGEITECGLSYREFCQTYWDDFE